MDDCDYEVFRLWFLDRISSLIQSMKPSVARLSIFIVLGILAGFSFSASGEIFLGPTDSGPSSGGKNWWYGQYGASTVHVDFSDPASKGSYDLVMSNSVADKESKSDWRSPPFSLGPAAAGARRVTFSFAYKLPDTVAKKNNILVQLRFFDATGTNFISQIVVPVGAKSGDSEMNGYKTIRMGNIVVPRRAQTADVWIDANIFELWVSGTAQFADISVTTPSRSWLYGLIAAAIVLAVCVGAALSVYFIKRNRAAA
jgi:hypothetical protein